MDRRSLLAHTSCSSSEAAMRSARTASATDDNDSPSVGPDGGPDDSRADWAAPSGTAAARRASNFLRTSSSSSHDRRKAATVAKDRPSGIATVGETGRRRLLRSADEVEVRADAGRGEAGVASPSRGDCDCGEYDRRSSADRPRGELARAALDDEAPASPGVLPPALPWLTRLPLVWARSSSAVSRARVAMTSRRASGCEIQTTRSAAASLHHPGTPYTSSSPKMVMGCRSMAASSMPPASSTLTVTLVPVTCTLCPTMDR
mmetsp:Transcript_5503/g.17824  ORF Transcript_5503/g.17824 Transcript_5503/m.17824 type:complete len:261 (+) Transcript_5503:884-1666(+)